MDTQSRTCAHCTMYLYKLDKQIFNAFFFQTCNPIRGNKYFRKKVKMIKNKKLSV